MATQKQIDANRRNALRSTGPRTPEGKARSRLNALKHGFSSGLGFLPPDRRREFNQCYQALIRDLAPSPPQDLLVYRLAAAVTNLHACAAFENELFTRALADQRIQHPEFSELRLLGRTFLTLCRTGAFDTLLRYQSRTQRAFQRACAELLRLKMKNGRNQPILRLPDTPAASAPPPAANSLSPQSISAKIGA